MLTVLLLHDISMQIKAQCFLVICLFKYICVWTSPTPLYITVEFFGEEILYNPLLSPSNKNTKLPCCLLTFFTVLEDAFHRSPAAQTVVFIILRSVWLPARVSADPGGVNAKVKGLADRGPELQRQGLQQRQPSRGGFGAGSGGIERFAPGRAIVLLGIYLPPSPLAINAGDAARPAEITSSLGGRTQTQAAMWRTLASLPSQSSRSRGTATRLRVVQSEHPMAHFPQGDWIREGGGGSDGATTLPGTADNWLINAVLPVCQRAESRDQKR